MRLYHRGFRNLIPNTTQRFQLQSLLLSVFLAALLTACGAAPQATQSLIQVQLFADGQTIPMTLPAGSSVQSALDQAGLTLNTLDRTEPSAYTVLGDGDEVRLVRVTESFDVEQVTLPFERQTLRNESLPVEQEVLIQRGQNGLQEITYRRVFEDGVEISSEPAPINSVILSEPQLEIRMIGVQAPFSPVAVPGVLYYLRDGNLWKIEESTGNRRAVITTGDLDGRILSFSDDGSWLLFTRRAEVEGRINNLWAGYIGDPLASGAPDEERLLVDLSVDNVIHFADWAPESNTRVLFSTVEPRPTAPGWQANNDLQALTFSDTGWTTQWTTIIEPGAGGVYGWWGTSYQFSPDRSRLIFVRPDGIGSVNYKTGVVTGTLELIPYQTRQDWAWVPGITWGPDGNVLYLTEHGAPTGGTSPEESTNFDLSALLLNGGSALRLVSATGMFAYPLASPLQNPAGGDLDYQLAYLQALFPEQSDSSRYRVTVMDRDGSNRRMLFPSEEAPGLQPQLHWGAWSPAPMPASQHYALAVIYEGNLWLVDTVTEESVQLTGDGLTTRVIWK